MYEKSNIHLPNSLGRIKAMLLYSSSHYVTSPEAVSLLNALLLWTTLTSNIHTSKINFVMQKINAQPFDRKKLLLVNSRGGETKNYSLI